MTKIFNVLFGVLGFVALVGIIIAICFLCFGTQATSFLYDVLFWLENLLQSIDKFLNGFGGLLK
jgi:hypothetical protein